MDPFAPSPLAPWWMAGSAIAGAIIVKTVDWWLGRRRDRASDDLIVAKASAEIELLDVLKTRIDHLEARQAELERRIIDEIHARLQAMEESSRLRLRVLQLEVVLRSHGIEIPDTLDAMRDPEAAHAA